LRRASGPRIDHFIDKYVEGVLIEEVAVSKEESGMPKQEFFIQKIELDIEKHGWLL